MKEGEKMNKLYVGIDVGSRDNAVYIIDVSTNSVGSYKQHTIKKLLRNDVFVYCDIEKIKF